MRTVIYARLSKRTDKNALNLDDQLKRCREWASKHGWTVTAECRDYGESAFDRESMEDRPGFGDLLTLVRERQVDAVLAWRPDRLFRDPIEQALFFRECARSGVSSVATVMEGERNPADPGDEMVGTIIAAVARYESNAKSQRLLAKQRQNAERGKPATGGSRPYGYDDDKVTVVKSEARIIRRAAERVLKGDSLYRIVKDMNAKGLTTVSGGQWTTIRLKKILTGARWAGMREHRGRIVADGAWPAILSVDELTRLRAVLLDPARRRGDGRRREYLLSGGLARCALCDAPLVARPRPNGYRGYACVKAPNFRGCGGILRVAGPLEEHVIGRVFAAIDDGVVADAEPAIDPAAAVLSLVEVEERLRGLSRDHYVLGVISRDQFLAACEPLNDRAEQLRAEAERNSVERVPLKNLRKRWATMTLDDKRSALAELIDAVIVHPGTRSNKFDPRLVEVRWKG